MKNRSGQREPVDIPRERRDGWGDDDATPTPTPQEQSHPRQFGEEVIPGETTEDDRHRHVIDDAGVRSSEVVDTTDE